MNIFDLFRRKKKIPTPWAKYYSDADLNIKIPNISMYDCIKKSCEKFTFHTAYAYMGKKVSYNKFLKQIDKASLLFKEFKLKKGDIVTLLLPNVPEALIV